MVPDIHQRIASVSSILSAESSADEFVFLGDWFDCWDSSSPGTASFDETCRYLRSLMTSHPRSSRFVFLLGNHDLPYIYQNSASSRSAVKGAERYACSGFSRSKARAFRKAFYDHGYRDKLFLEKFRIAHRSQGITLSHAGIHASHLLKGEAVEEMVLYRLPSIWLNFRNAAYSGNGLLSDCGKCRGGSETRGGLLWLDWNMEFAHSERLGRQIVGHTHVPEPECRAMGTPSESWDIDTGRNYGVIIDGRVVLREIPRPSP